MRVILGTGAFNWGATRLTAALLAILAVGLVAQGLVLLFSRAVYAVRQSWRPLFYQLAGGAFTAFLAVGFLLWPKTGLPSMLATFLRVGNVPGTDILLLALAATLRQIFLAILSRYALHSVAPGLSRTLLRPLPDGLTAALLGGIAAHGVLMIEGGIAPLTTLGSVLTEGFVAGMVGLAIAALTLLVVKNEEFSVMVSAFNRLMSSRSGRVGVLPGSADEPAQA